MEPKPKGRKIGWRKSEEAKIAYKENVNKCSIATSLRKRDSLGRLLPKDA
jgi:hypothetical protein